MVPKSFKCFVLSLADMDEHLIMEDGSLVWTCKDVLQHQNDKMIPLRIISSYVVGLFKNINKCASDPTRMQQLSIYYLSVLILQLYGFDGILELVKLIIVEILYTETESAFEAYVFYILFLLR